MRVQYLEIAQNGPNYLPLNVFTALKGSDFYFYLLFSMQYFI